MGEIRPKTREGVGITWLPDAERAADSAGDVERGSNTMLFDLRDLADATSTLREDHEEATAGTVGERT